MSDSLIFLLFYAGGVFTCVVLFVLWLYLKMRKASKPMTREEMQNVINSLQFRVPGIEYTMADRFKDFRYVSDDERGKRVISEIINECDKTTYEREAGDHGTLAFREGKRYVGRWIVGILTHRPFVDN